MTGCGLKSEVLRTGQRRRRRTPAERLAILAATQEPGVTVSLVARPEPLFLWRRLASQGALTAAQSEEPVASASEYRSLLAQVRESQRLLGKKTMEAEILKEALEFSAGSKKHLLRSLWWPKDGSR
jgi:transposase